MGDCMSRIRIYGDTSGYLEIKAPSVAGNRTITIPEGGFAGVDESVEYASSASANAVIFSNSYTNSELNSASALIVSSIVNTAPETLNTLSELASAINDDPVFSTTVTNAISQKLSIASASSTYATFAYAIGAASSASANADIRALGYVTSASTSIQNSTSSSLQAIEQRINEVEAIAILGL